MVRYIRDGFEDKAIPSQVAEDKALLALRRRGYGLDQIADELGYADRFEVIDALNSIYKRMRPVNVDEIRDNIESQVDDLVTVYQESALNGDIKAAKFVLDALRLKAQLRGAITPPQINVQVNNQKPWERVYRATLSDENVVDGEIVSGEIADDSYTTD